MAKNKRYYWLKLKEDFFNDDAIEWLEDRKNGKEYCLFYLKLCLKSIRTDGILIRNVGKLLIPYDIEKLAEMTKTDIDTAVVAMELLKKIGLVEIMDDGSLYMSQLQSMVGSESESAARMRKLRAKQDELSLCDKNVTTEKEIEKDKDTDIEKEIESESTNEPVELFDLERAWNDTLKVYPKKTAIFSAKTTWMNKLLEVIEPNRKDVATLIWKATKAYVADYVEKNPDDTAFRYIPKFGEWLKEDCDYWISIIENQERSNAS